MIRCRKMSSFLYDYRAENPITVFDPISQTKSLNLSLRGLLKRTHILLISVILLSAAPFHFFASFYDS